jgi:hypothetical protein
MSPLKKTIATLVLLFSASAAALGQAKSTASRAGDLQVGVGYTTADSDYLPNRIRGLAFYADFDFKQNLGIEVDFHQLNDPNSSKVYERTYEFGGRYVRNYNRVSPYVKVLYGRGVFNFPQDEANLAYNMLVGGIGLDVHATQRINVRGDFEYQKWSSFPPNGLSPTLITIGVAYHFPAGRPRG